MGSRTKKSSVSSGYKNFAYAESDEDIEDVEERGCCSRFCYRVFPAGPWKETKAMFHITWPIVLTQVCQMIIGPISLIFCGHLGDPIKLDGAALAISMVNATCVSVGQGLGTTCDTFFSQSYGSKNKKQVGTYLQRALLFFVCALVGCFCFHVNMELILITLGQHREVSKLAGDYMLIFMPGALGFFLYVPLTKYIQNQNIVMPNVFIGFFANAVNALLHYVFLYKMNMGTNGSAIAQSVSYVLMFVLTLMYIIIFKKYKTTWDGWSWDCLRDWGTFTRLAIPGMFMVCLEWWGFEIGVFLTGVLGTTELGAQSLLLQIDSIYFQVPLGIQIACAIRVGQYLGAGSALGAVTAGRLAIIVVAICASTISLTFLAFRFEIPKLFTNVAEISQLTGELLPIVSLYMFFDGIATACKGVLYGTGRQNLGAVILFVTYYLMALPIGIPLMFLTDLRGAGYWWALAINLFIQATVLLVLIYRTNWDQEVSKAQERAGLLQEEVDDEENLYYGPRDDKDSSETKPLLSDGPHERRRRRSSSRRRLLSSSLNIKQIKELTGGLGVEKPQSPLSEVIFKRLLLAIIMLALFGLSLAVRFMVPVSSISQQNGYQGNNSTLPYDVIYNMTTQATL